MINHLIIRIRKNPKWYKRQFIIHPMKLSYSNQTIICSRFELFIDIEGIKIRFSVLGYYQFDHVVFSFHTFFPQYQPITTSMRQYFTLTTFVSILNEQLNMCEMLMFQIKPVWVAKADPLCNQGHKLWWTSLKHWKTGMVIERDRKSVV